MPLLSSLGSHDLPCNLGKDYYNNPKEANLNFVNVSYRQANSDILFENGKIISETVCIPPNASRAHEMARVYAAHGLIHSLIDPVDISRCVRRLTGRQSILKRV